MKKIIIVDDQAPSMASIAHWLAGDIEELTQGEYGAELLEGVIIADALPLLKKYVKKMQQLDGTVVGILIDFVDETSNEPNAGALLLKKVKADPELKAIPIVVYTSKQTRDFSPTKLKEKGAKAAIRRVSVGSGSGDLGRQTLDAFEIPYTGSRTGSTGPY
jgi:hypothetical protein